MSMSLMGDVVRPAASQDPSSAHFQIRCPLICLRMDPRDPPVLCRGEADTGLGPPTTLTVTLSPTAVTVGVGESLSIAATVRDETGKVVSGHAVAWTSSDEAVATVGSGGTVQGLAPGQVTITATVSLNGTTDSATASVTVVQEATTVSVTPSTTSVPAGETVQFTAEVLDGLGGVIDGAAATWTSSD